MRDGKVLSVISITSLGTVLSFPPPYQFEHERLVQVRGMVVKISLLFGTITWDEKESVLTFPHRHFLSSLTIQCVCSDFFAEDTWNEDGGSEKCNFLTKKEDTKPS